MSSHPSPIPGYAWFTPLGGGEPVLMKVSDGPRWRSITEDLLFERLSIRNRLSAAARILWTGIEPTREDRRTASRAFHDPR